MAPARFVYLDNNATTRLAPEALDAMLPLLRDDFGNPGSPHGLGTAASKALGAARRSLAERLGTDPVELIFTAGGTEANNLALRGIVGLAKSPAHVVTTAIEHPSVLQTCEALAESGVCDLTVLPVDENGLPDLAEFEASLRPGATCLVSIMGANNETGVILPIAEMGEMARARGAVFHVDGIQLAGKVELNVGSLPVDLMSLSAHKFHGPKGTGLLYVRRGTRLAAQLTGGGQERGRRPGTENPAAIVGMAQALELVNVDLPGDIARMARLRDRLQDRLTEQLPQMQVSASGVDRLPNTLHCTFRDAEADALLLLLDRAGIACSASSACSTGALEPSHVIRAMGLPPERLHGALRLCLSRETTEAEVDFVAAELPPLVRRLSSLTA